MSTQITVTDQFCGAGGSSQGAFDAGLEVKLALNHWKLAIETHNTNFPDVLHDCTDISACDPRRYPKTNVLITSPECTNHSQAKGKKRTTLQMDMFDKKSIDPAADRSRATMWDVPRFAEYHDYKVIVVENVVEARHWVMWEAWLMAMRSLGYEHQFVFFNSQFAPPTPQSRDRMYIVFHKRGNRAPDLKFTPPAYCQRCEKEIGAIQSWKNPVKCYGRYKQQYVYRCPDCAGEVRPYYQPAATAIDWGLEAPIIRDRKIPLRDKTLRRIELGLKMFGGQAQIMNTAYSHALNQRARPVSEAMFTQSTRQEGALVVPPFILDHVHEYRPRSLSDPLSTIVADGNHQSLITPPGFISEFYGTSVGRSISDPLGTMTTSGSHHGLVTMPFLLSYYGNDNGHKITDALGTVTTVDRHSLVMPAIDVLDCGFRMLQPEEIKAAMAFRRDYIVLGSNRDKVKQLGNAVTPPVMAMIMKRVAESLS